MDAQLIVTALSGGATVKELARKLSAEESEVRKVLRGLEAEGKVVRKGNRYYPRDGVEERLRRLEEIVSFYFPPPDTLAKEFDEAYKRVADSAGYAQLKAIRLEMGLTQEVFYKALRGHIEANYDLVAGGDEGYVRKGVMFGIVRRRA